MSGQIKSKERVRLFSEVFTDKREVTAILDLVGDDVASIERTFLEPACGNGNFLVEVLHRKLKVAETVAGKDKDRFGFLAAKAVSTIYGIDIMEDNISEARERLYKAFQDFFSGSYDGAPGNDCEAYVKLILAENIQTGDTLKMERPDGSPITIVKWGFETEKGITKSVFRYCDLIATGCSCEPVKTLELCHSPGSIAGVDMGNSHGANGFEREETAGMNFSVVAGNPPYARLDHGANASAVPIYQKFVEQAISLDTVYIAMIIPSRWYSGGRGLTEFRREMMNDSHIREIHDFRDASECFPDIDISGGIWYFLRDKGYDGPCKVVNEDGDNRTEAERFLNEFPIVVRDNRAVYILNKILSMSSDMASTYVSSQKPFGLRTYARPDEEGDLILRWNGGRGPIQRSKVIAGINLIDKWKVITSRVFFEHAGKVNKSGMARVLSALEILGPGEVCTETYIVANHFERREEAENFCGYMRTKFVRFLIQQASSSIMITRGSFVFVPMQDFSQPWDDEKLYNKYGLDVFEKAFIERTIKPMSRETISEQVSESA